MAGCLEAEFLNVPLTTVRNYRGGFESGLNHYGGVVYALSSRTDIKGIEDLKDKIVDRVEFQIMSASVAGSNFKLCQHQWRVFEDAGVSLMADTKQVRFSSNGEDSLIDDVLDGISDAAFTRTDAIEDWRQKHPEKKNLLRILSPVTPAPVLDGIPFPFETTSELYPEYGLLAGIHVEWELQREVLQALLSLTVNDTITDDMYCNITRATGKNAAGDQLAQSDAMVEGQPCTINILANAQIAAFQPALSYGPARDLFETLGLMTLDRTKRRWRCVRADEMWEGISCPEGMFKLSRSEVKSGCADQGQVCTDTYTCLCRPCKRAKEVEIMPLEDTAQRAWALNASASSQDLRRQSSSSSYVGGCEKMEVCGKIRQKDVLVYRLADNRLRGQMALTWKLREGAATREGVGAAIEDAGAFNAKYSLSVSSTVVGVHILQIMFDGKQVPASPILLEVDPALCTDSSKIADEQGECRCNSDKGWTGVAGGRCMKLAVLITIIVLPVLFALVVFGFSYIKVATKMADSIWEIQIEDLHFDTPTEILGRGTFGLVVAANYNTTRVAVKRVIPIKGGGKSAALRKGYNLLTGARVGNKEEIDEMFKIKPQDDMLSGKCTYAHIHTYKHIRGARWDCSTHVWASERGADSGGCGPLMGRSPQERAAR
eukprot:CAMPEP_0173063384 /NCGR_PEP_ID=MMETSP1102-20130122/4355_1 /TAXON_ID=49646 /ORGANISM="Geminigera sp., Strain Caron Lab Isolate" /LENGTH=657 /DNA_ID=CAMNT_0013930183 /DNA_START=160 /DNA_END=2132 /DNA_ORIENTATION=+